MSEHSQIANDAVRELVTANRILGHEGVVDALGHVSVRHPENAGRYLLSCSRSPELVTEDDIMEFDLDSNPIDQRGRNMYVERSIHGCVYQARPDVNAVCHSHAHELIPFRRHWNTDQAHLGHGRGHGRGGAALGHPGGLPR